MDAHIERLIGQRDYRGAVGALATAHGKALGRFCAGLLGSAEDGQEALQEAFVQALAALPGYRGEGVRAWAFAIARHVCAAELRKRTRRRGIWARIFSGEAAAPREDQATIADADARLTVDKALGRLTPRLREALLLRYQQGMDAAEVADVLHISHAAARKRISLGLRGLRAQLDVAVSGAPDAEDGANGARRPFEDGLGERS
jgi:RNA polymerase sigma-70 factor (ECF subfamily)